jgi:hypothetical protein
MVERSIIDSVAQVAYKLALAGLLTGKSKNSVRLSGKEIKRQTRVNVSEYCENRTA